MNARRVAGAVASAGLGLVVFSVIAMGAPGAGAATPVGVSFNSSGMASVSCPLPLNGSIALKPGTGVQLLPDAVLGPLSTESLTIKPAPNSSDPASTKTYNLATKPTVSFTTARTYTVSWVTETLNLVSATQTGKLVIDAEAAKCAVAVSVPVPSASAPVPGASAITDPVNGLIGSAVNGVNSAISPVNGAVGGLLGGVNGAVGGVVGALPGGGSGPTGGPTSSPDPRVDYQPPGESVADRTVPKGYGNGSGAAGDFVTSDPSGSGTTATGAKNVRAGRAGAADIVTDPLPSIDIAQSSPRTALDAMPTLLAVLAVIALSATTAFYGRTFLVRDETPER